MKDEDFERRFEICKMGRNSSLLLSLYKEANEKQRHKILQYEELKLLKIKSNNASDGEGKQKELITKLKKIK